MDNKNLKNSRVVVETSGLNFEKFLNKLIEKNINIKNIKKNEKIVIFEIDYINYNLIKNIDNNREFKILKIKGKKVLYDFLKNRLGLVVGLIISIFIFIFCSFFTFNISIIGLENLNEKEIIMKLKNFGIEKNSIIKKSNNEISDFLINNFNEISLVSVKKNGNSLIINIKEKLKMSETIGSDLIASENMLITNISVYSGTANCKVGDYVKKGAVLVYAHMQDGSNEINKCEVVADIDAECFFSDSYEFKKIKNEFKKTKKKKNIINYFIGNKKITNNIKKCDFENYDILEKEYYISTFLLPIKVKKVVYYEKKLFEVQHNFELEKDKIISDCYNKLINKIPLNMPIISEDVVINELEDGYIINVYVKANFKIRGEK